jgi:DNA-binding SARP family transcriptional activator
MLLLAEANRAVAVERLIDAIWDEAPPETARNQIYICISRLRKLCDDAGLPDLIGTASGGYILRTPDDELDLRVFERLVRLARIAAGEGRYLEAEGDYRRALALWRGDALTVGNSRVLQGFETLLIEQRVSVLEEWVNVRLKLGSYHDVVGDLMDLVTRFPLRERARAQLMIVLYRSGRQAEALEVYRAGRKILVEQLGIEPNEELRRLERDILSGVADLRAATSATSPPTFAVPPRAHPVTPHLLPADVSDFTGRAGQIQLLHKYLLPDRSVDPSEAVPIVTPRGNGWPVKRLPRTTRAGSSDLRADPFDDRPEVHAGRKAAVRQAPFRAETGDAEGVGDGRRAVPDQEGGLEDEGEAFDDLAGAVFEAGGVGEGVLGGADGGVQVDVGAFGEIDLVEESVEVVGFLGDGSEQVQGGDVA